MIETARLHLRPWEQADRPAFHALVNTPGMMAQLGGPKPDAAIDALLDKRLNDQRRHGCSYWATELRATGELIGSCGVRVADNYAGQPVADMVEAGWRIAEQHWGQGYAAEAAAAGIAWVWENRSDERVAAWTTSGNGASRAVAARIGMARRPDLDFRRVEDAETLIVHVIERPR